MRRGFNDSTRLRPFAFLLFAVATLLAPDLGHAAAVSSAVFNAEIVGAVVGAMARSGQSPQYLDPSFYNDFHKVAVLSAIGTTFTLQSEVSHKTALLDVADWKIDDEASAIVNKSLSGGFSLADIVYDRGALAAIPNGRWNASFGPLRTYLKSLDRAGIDAFVVVRPDIEGSAAGVPGLTLLDRGKNGQTLWANFEIDVIDGHNFALVEKSFAKILADNGIQESPANASLSENVQVTNPVMLSDSEQSALRSRANALLKEALAGTLNTLIISAVRLPHDASADQPQNAPAASEN